MERERFRGTWQYLPVSVSLFRRADEFGVAREKLIIWGSHVVRGDVWLETVLPEKYKQWRVASRLAVQDGQLVVAELRVFPVEEAPSTVPPGLWSAEVLGVAAQVPRGGLPGRLLRRIRIGQPAKHTERFLGLAKGKHLFRFFPELGLRPAGEPRRAQRPRRDRRSDVFLAQLAAAYVKAVQRGDRRPIRRLAAQRRTVAPKVRDMLHEARERGLLTRGVQGRSGGALTAPARELLAATRRQRATTRRRSRR